MSFYQARSVAWCHPHIVACSHVRMVSLSSYRIRALLYCLIRSDRRIETKSCMQCMVLGERDEVVSYWIIIRRHHFQHRGHLFQHRGHLYRKSGPSADGPYGDGGPLKGTLMCGQIPDNHHNEPMQPSPCACAKRFFCFEFRYVGPKSN